MLCSYCECPWSVQTIPNKIKSACTELGKFWIILWVLWNCLPSEYIALDYEWGLWDVRLCRMAKFYCHIRHACCLHHRCELHTQHHEKLNLEFIFDLFTMFTTTPITWKVNWKNYFLRSICMRLLINKHNAIK